MIELLKYMEHSTDEVSEVCKSERIQKMHRRICQIKESEKTEVKYMQSWEEKILIKQEGIAEGKLEEKQELMRKLSNKFSIEQIAEMLEIDISEVENILKESQNGSRKYNKRTCKIIKAVRYIPEDMSDRFYRYAFKRCFRF